MVVIPQAPLARLPYILHMHTLDLFPNKNVSENNNKLYWQVTLKGESIEKNIPQLRLQFN